MWSENSDNNSFEVETFVGRTLEKERLREAAGGPQSAFVAVYGRRRVGKTMLIRHVFNNDFTFQATAVANVDKQQQLINFTTALRRYDGREELVVPTTWFAAFQQLIDYLEQCNESRKVIFLDELPWFDNQRSDFIQSLEHFWNSWAATRTDIVLLVCGSAASWMINELINHRGGLHNRVTERILVEPFNLKETEQLLKIKNPAIDRYQVLQLYMVMGGIPFYLNAVKKTESAAQNIDRLFFTRDGLLRNEFDNLYRALFRRSERHIAVVRAIATKAKGLSRKEILQLTQLPDNSTLNQ
ncbi:MAG: ATP-binding protein, partial [Bacteroidota bacterium]